MKKSPSFALTLSLLVIIVFVNPIIVEVYSQDRVYPLAINEKDFYVEYVVDDYVNATVYKQSLRYADTFKFQIYGYNEVTIDLPRTALKVPIGDIYFQHIPGQYKLVMNSTLLVFKDVGIINMFVRRVYPILVFIPVDKDWIDAFNSSLKSLVGIYRREGYNSSFKLTYEEGFVLGKFRKLLSLTFNIRLYDQTVNDTILRHEIELKYDVATGLLTSVYFVWDNPYLKFTRPFSEERIELKMHILVTNSQEIVGNKVKIRSNFNTSIYLLIASILTFVVGTILVKIKEMREYKPVFEE